MADQYSWENANLANYKTTLQSLNRKTIADGAMLNSAVIEPFSSRDQYLIDNCNDINISANSLYSTIETNSAENWNNSKLSGFSAFLFNDKSIIGKQNANETITFQFKYPFTVTTAVDKITIGANSLNESYFQLAKSANSDISYPNIANEPPRGSNNGLALVFGANNKLPSSVSTNYLENSIVLFDNSEAMSTHAIAMVNSNASDAGFSFNSSTNNYYAGIGFNNSNDCTSGSIGINSSTAISCGIAFDSSLAIGHSLAITNSTAMYDAVAEINSIAQQRAYAILNSTANSCGAAYIHSFGSNNSFSIINSYGQDASVAMINSVASANGVALVNSNVYSAGVAIDDSSATNDGFAFCHSTEEHHSVAMNYSYAKNGSFAYFDSSASNGAYASHNSSAIDGSVSIFASQSKRGAFAVLSSDASNGSIAINNSSANNGSVAINNSCSTDSCLRSIALFDSRNFAQSGAYAAYFATDKWYTEYNLLSYGSTISAYTAYFETTPVATAMNDVFVGHNLIMYNSTGGGFGGQFAMYSSLISGYVGECVAMYDSSIKALDKLDGMLTTQNSFGLTTYQNEVYVCNFHKYIAALYDSNVILPNNKSEIDDVNTVIDSAIFLWNNSVVLEPYNTVNKFRIVSNFDGNVKPLDIFKPEYINTIQPSLRREYLYYKHRNVLYVGV